MQIFEIRRKLGEDVVRTAPGGYRLSPALAVELIPSPSASDLEKLLVIALDQVKAQTTIGLQAAVESCRNLLEKGRVADAYAAIALASINLGGVGYCREIPKISIGRARQILDTGLKWFPEFGAAYALRGLTYLVYDYDWTKAEADLREALKLSPKNELAHCFLSHLLVYQGKFDEGLEHATEASKYDYDSPMTVVTEPWLMLFAGRLDEAIAKGEEVMKLFQQSGPGHALLGHIYLAAGDTNKALDQYQRSLKVDRLPDTIASQGYVYGITNKRRKALECSSALRRAKSDWPMAYVSSYHDALIWTGLGEKQRALDALEKAFEEKCDWLVQMVVEPRWKILHDEPRFRSLLTKVGLRPLNAEP
jgi:tetratricopeptide (TPR) repeat protein